MSLTHLFFDLIAWGISFFTIAHLSQHLPYKTQNKSYYLALIFGVISGAYLLGTLNLYLSAQPQIGRSFLGGLCGGILVIELYKYAKKIKGSTGYIFALPLCLSISIGRIGCQFSGLNDQTFGSIIPKNTFISNQLGWDYGDGILRHPVAAYESFTMAAAAVFLAYFFRKYPNLYIKYSFYIAIGFYSFQRFIWEFLKPYGTIIGNLNIFHIACLILICYSLFMILTQKNKAKTP